MRKIIVLVIVTYFNLTALWGLANLNNPSVSTYQSLFTTTITIATTSGTTTVTAGASVFGNGALNVGANDRVWVNNGGTWQFAGTVTGRSSNTTVTISGGISSLGTASNFIILPPLATGFTITLDNNTPFTIDLPNISDSLVISAVNLGKASPAGQAGLLTINSNNSSGLIVIKSITISGVAANEINLTNGILKLWVSPIISNLTWNISANGHTVEYVNSTVVAPWAYNNLIINNGAKTVSSSFTVAGILTVSATGILNMGNNTLSVSNSLSNSGVIRTTCSTATSSTPLTLPAGTWGGTIEYASTSAQTVVPGTYTNLTLSGGSLKAVDASVSAKSLTVNTLLTINSTDNLDLSSSSSTSKITLTVAKFAGTGSVKGSKYSAILYTGNQNSTLYMDQTSNALDYLKLSASANLTLGNQLVLEGGGTNKANGDLEMANSSSITSNTTVANTPAYIYLKFNQTSDEHAWIGGLNQTTTPTITGEILFEDCTSGGTRWYSQIGFCTDSLSLNQITDDFDLWGIQGSGAGGRGLNKNLDGLYQSTTTESNSVFTYDESKKTSSSSTTSRWVPFTYQSATPNVIPLGTGIMLLMRPSGSGQSGNYNKQLFEYEGPSSITTKTKSLTESGYLKGLTSPSYAGHGYNLLCNPYPTHLNLNTFFSENPDLNRVFIKYDRFNKGYKTYTKPGSKWIRNSSTTDENDGIINPGDVFWVTIDKNKTSPTVATFNPSQISNTTGAKPGTPNKMELDSSSYTFLGIGLFPGLDTVEADAALLVMNSSMSNMDFDSKSGDAFKFGATCNELSILSSEDMRLSIKTLSQSKNWTVPLKVELCKVGKSKFRFGLNYNKPGQEYQYYLVDKFKNTSYKINDLGEYYFDVTEDPATYGTGRFYINGTVNPSLSKHKTITEQINIYPNPSTREDIVYISLPGGIENAVVKIQNNAGQVIKSSDEQVKDGFVSFTVEDLKLQSGIYFLSISTKNLFYTQKLIIR